MVSKMLFNPHFLIGKKKQTYQKLSLGQRILKCIREVYDVKSIYKLAEFVKKCNRCLKCVKLYDNIIISYFYFYFSVLIKQFLMLLGDGGKMQVRWSVGAYKRVGAFFLPKNGKTPPKVRRKDE